MWPQSCRLAPTYICYEAVRPGPGPPLLSFTLLSKVVHKDGAILPLVSKPADSDKVNRWGRNRRDGMGIERERKVKGTRQNKEETEKRALRRKKDRKGLRLGLRLQP